VFLFVSFYKYQGFEIKVCNLGSQHTVFYVADNTTAIEAALVTLVIFDLDSLQCQGLQSYCNHRPS
jgi:hypothetical protein